MATKKTSKKLTKKPQSKKVKTEPGSQAEKFLADLCKNVPPLDLPILAVDQKGALQFAQDSLALSRRLAEHVDVLADASRGTQNVLADINAGLGSVLPRAVSALERIADALEVFSKTNVAIAASPSTVVGHGEIENTDGSISQDFTRELGAPSVLADPPGFVAEQVEGRLPNGAPA